MRARGATGRRGERAWCCMDGAGRGPLTGWKGCRGVLAWPFARPLGSVGRVPLPWAQPWRPRMHFNVHSRPLRPFAPCVAIAAALSAAFILGACCSDSHKGDAPAVVAEVPQEIAVSGPVIARVHATGYQVY